ncbi:MAG: preprotein translocase subunit SecA [Candidatus Doudnabacteria bacterium]|nr:preprotein translocase subunit SecA [Candidatus Doudnabacteria bacterium]
MSLWNRVFGDPDDKYLKSLEPLVERINGLESDVQKLSDVELQAKTDEFKKRLKEGETLDDLLPEAFAVVREVSQRTLGMRHFDVQLLGGMILHRGRIAEMRTGEGKTLTSTLPVYLNALEGKGVHVVTVNSYLASRDAEWMGEIYAFLGLTVGVTDREMDPQEKREAYQADITYGTNNEFGFDYLRDNMAGDMQTQVQRKLNYAIIDEVDSVLIDEARTPLIISAPDNQSTSDYARFSRLVAQLTENEHYNVDEKLRSAALTDEGIKKLEELLGVENIYEEGGISIVHHLEQALRAQTLYTRDKDYVVRDNEVLIIDEFTGRILPGRRYSEGLHQAIEAKEGVEVQQHSRTMATITFQNFFRQYDRLSGMTGTAKTEEEEFQQIYGLEVTVVPTNKPIERNDMSDRIYQSEVGKFQAVIREVKERHEKGQPVLIGTASVEKNELLSNALTQAGIRHEVLNAKNHDREADIIEEAGKPGAVTLATNMAGRGVDIKLGGSDASKEEVQRVKDLGGLFVLGTERHEARRIDNQLRGRSGRQGDAGASQFFVSAEDDLLRIFGSDRMKTVMKTLKVPEDEPVEHSMITRSLQTAQKRVEGANFDTRKHVLKYDDVMNKHREVVYARRQAILKAWERAKAEDELLRGPNEESLLTEEELKDVPTLRSLIFDLFEAELERVVGRHTSGDEEEEWNTKEIAETMATVLPVPQDLLSRLDEIKEHPHRGKEGAECRTEMIDYLMELIRDGYEQKEQEVSSTLMRQIERMVLLRSVDTLWIEHLDEMARLREGIGLQGYGQKDPLVEYKKAGFGMFQALLENIQKQVVYSIFKVTIAQPKQASPMETEQNKMSTNSSDESGKGSKPSPAKKDEEVGRNDPCPCGSGKKYKKCHG